MDDLKGLSPEERDRIIKERLEKAFGSESNPKKTYDRYVFSNACSTDLPPPERTIKEWPKFLPHKMIFGTSAYKNINRYALYGTVAVSVITGIFIYVNINHSLNLSVKLLARGEKYMPTSEDRMLKAKKQRDMWLEPRRDGLAESNEAFAMSPSVGVYGYEAARSGQISDLP